MVVFLIIGIIDVIAGLMLIFSTSIILPEIAKYVGIILVAKGIWTVLISLSRGGG